MTNYNKQKERKKKKVDKQHTYCHQKRKIIDQLLYTLYCKHIMNITLATSYKTFNPTTIVASTNTKLHYIY